ncbi:hypothetical protein [Leisingera aquaemixtae]|uniref:hypothetical protein n=1 Tax=Leisingera aquaemixtae TaxID=1396826 RepID=UPI0021A6D609|nr:hypothetical protein [Leisingera aquaemixtae]
MARGKRVDGTAVWGCSAAPRDLRLPAVLLSLLALAVLATLVMDTSAHFDRFARALRDTPPPGRARTPMRCRARESCRRS